MGVRQSEPDITCTAVLNELAVTGGGMILRHGQRAFYLHVDDGLFAGINRLPENDPARLMELCANKLEKSNMMAPTRLVGDEVDKIVGYAPERHPARLRLDSRRRSLLYDSLNFLLRRARVHTGRLHSVIAIWVWGSLLRRELLAIPFAVFKMLAELPNQETRWWPSVRREVARMRDALLGMVADLGAPAPAIVYATDASGADRVDHGGFGIVASPVSPSLRDSCVLAGTRPGLTVANVNGDPGKLFSPGFQARPTAPFSVLPDALWSDPDREWTTLEAGRWRYTDHITLGEGRATVRLLERASAVPGLHRTKMISLEDNQAWGGAAAKGRSPSIAVNFLCRRKCALSLACNISMLLPWCETRRMPADGASRTRKPPASLGPSSGEAGGRKYS